MTRKEELQARARDFVSLFAISGVEPAAMNNLTLMLQQVERTVWARCADKIEALMEHENESTDDQIWELLDWCREQQEGL